MKIKHRESWVSAAGCVLLGFRATMAWASRPHQTETDLFWRYISKEQMCELYEHVVKTVLPDESSRGGL